MKIKGLKKAIGTYKEANKGGAYDPNYGYLMFNKETGELWTDEFYAAGHTSWKEYADENIINIGKMMEEREIEINMENVKKFVIIKIESEGK